MTLWSACTDCLFAMVQRQMVDCSNFPKDQVPYFLLSIFMIHLVRIQIASLRKESWKVSAVVCSIQMKEWYNNTINPSYQSWENEGRSDPIWVNLGIKDITWYNTLFVNSQYTGFLLSSSTGLIPGITSHKFSIRYAVQGVDPADAYGLFKTMELKSLKIQLFYGTRFIWGRNEQNTTVERYIRRLPSTQSCKLELFT